MAPLTNNFKKIKLIFKSNTSIRIRYTILTFTSQLDVYRTKNPWIYNYVPIGGSTRASHLSAIKKGDTDKKSGGSS